MILPNFFYFIYAHYLRERERGERKEEREIERERGRERVWSIEFAT